MESPKQYNTKDMARILAVSRQTIFNHLQAGHIKAVKYGGQWRVFEDEMQRIVHEGFGPKNDNE